jgi:hypothetical protein
MTVTVSGTADLEREAIAMPRVTAPIEAITMVRGFLKRRNVRRRNETSFGFMGYEDSRFFMYMKGIQAFIE